MDLTEEKKSLILAALKNSESLEDISTNYGVPIILLREWQNNPIPITQNAFSNVSTTFKELLSESISESDSSIKTLKVKLNKAALAIVHSILNSDILDVYSAKVLQIHADSLSKLRNSFCKDDSTGEDSPSSSTELTKFKKLLRD